MAFDFLKQRYKDWKSSDQNRVNRIDEVETGNMFQVPKIQMILQREK